MAYSSKYLDKIDNRYWVVIGDGECAEGSIWEAAHLASYYKLDNLTAILDINRLGQSQETSIGHDIEVYKKRFEAFGWSVIKVDGHNITALAEAMEKVMIKIEKQSAETPRINLKLFWPKPSRESTSRRSRTSWIGMGSQCLRIQLSI